MIWKLVIWELLACHLRQLYCKKPMSQIIKCQIGRVLQLLIMNSIILISCKKFKLILISLVTKVYSDFTNDHSITEKLD